MFNISIENKTVRMHGERALQGEITIGDFRESIILPVEYWNVDQYKLSWISSIEQGLLNRKHAVLLVSMRDIKKTNYLFSWVLYFVDESVYIHNSILFLDELEGFDVNNINSFVSPRETHTEEGDKISEWATSISSVKCFLNRLKSSL